ncbi:hypothetical protein ILYODFUR_028488 [Ilyodon furcidens]|uniref:Uncharacterized protein n=1 Tax=Ilyodon furcidens TaxID=33524 RepID=A0ABV0V8R7_9TELE
MRTWVFIKTCLPHSHPPQKKVDGVETSISGKGIIQLDSIKVKTTKHLRAPRRFSSKCSLEPVLQVVLLQNIIFQMLIGMLSRLYLKPCSVLFVDESKQVVPN